MSLTLTLLISLACTGTPANTMYRLFSQRFVQSHKRLLFQTNKCHGNTCATRPGSSTFSHSPVFSYHSLYQPLGISSILLGFFTSPACLVTWVVSHCILSSYPFHDPHARLRSTVTSAKNTYQYPPPGACPPAVTYASVSTRGNAGDQLEFVILGMYHQGGMR